MKPAWTADAPLPGGDLPDADFDQWFDAFQKEHPWLDPDLALHYARCYGSGAAELLKGAGCMEDLGHHFGGLFYAREAEWLIEHEWARTAEDMLERRTKHALFMTKAEQRAVADWLARDKVA
jgi:glycerol-3-phosphate dehydrogenase